MKPIIKLCLGALLALLALCVSPASAQQLGLGDPAPKLAVSRFAKGAPVKSLEKGNLYVVEFWATWCGPCRETIPHLTKLQKQYPKVTFIGVSVLEENPSAVAPFVKAMGAKMDYRVALDSVPRGKSPQEGMMARNWMTAAGQSGIPAAFIVDRQGKVAWIGHPAQMDAPLEKIVQGKWDLRAAVAEDSKKRKMQRTLQALQGKLVAAQQSKNPKQVLAVINQAIATDPALEPMLGMNKFLILLEVSGSPAQNVAYGNRLADKLYAGNPEALNQLAWGIVAPGAPKRPVEVQRLALKSALKADQLTKGGNAAVADTLARAYFVSGDKAKAVSTQERAVRLGRGMKEAAGMQQSLEQYRKAARGGK